MRRLIDRVVRPLEIPRGADHGAAKLVDSEWLVTNGLGGYASSTVAGVITRRYHGLLVAALPNPLGRTVMLNHLGERIVLADGRSTYLSAVDQVAGRLDPDIASRLADFRLEAGLPVWRYAWEGLQIERRVLMPHKQNSVWIMYRLLSGDAAQLELYPAVHFRGYEDPVNTVQLAPGQVQYEFLTSGTLHRIRSDSPVPLPPLQLCVLGAASSFTAQAGVTSEFLYPVEESRGYQFRGTLWAPGHLSVTLTRGVTVSFVASTEAQEVMLALTPAEVMQCEHERRRRLLSAAVPAARDEVASELVLAADQFIFTPIGRAADATRAAATGDEIRSIIAGYHWFTDWGRDTMISLEGLTLVTGRQREAAFILRTFAHYVKDGLIPNMFPDGSNEGLYHTADATLWFFHALHRYLLATDDRAMLVQLLPTLQDIVARHVAGTHFGIAVDATDGLLRQGAAGYQLTWMDAKVDDWVVTPRRGKAVEINALWYNALRLLERWVREERGEPAARELTERAEQVRSSFNARFWMPERGYLFDYVDGEDGDSAQCRPNQVFAISLDHPVLARERWDSVMRVVSERLLTPVGLRSLAPGDRDYKQRYFGDLRARDAAYHQGTVWGWLIGPWVDAWLRVHPGDLAGARAFLSGCIAALDEFGLGTIGEIFDAEAPYTPRGCIAQAWSVAEVLRCLVRTAGALEPREAGAARGAEDARERERTKAGRR